MNSNSQNGFTLIEVLVVITIIGVLAVPLTAVTANYFDLSEAFRQKEQIKEIEAIKNTLLSVAAEENNGRLPSPYTGSGYNNSCLDITDGVQKAFLSQFSPVQISNINTDSSLERFVRRCQVVTGITYDKPVSGFGGPTITLTYDAGVAYQTNCPEKDSCNTGLVGNSGTYAVTGWTLTAPDTLAVEYTTLPIQFSMWEKTYEKLLTIRDRMMNFRIDMVRTNGADDVTNWNLEPNLPASTPLSGADAAFNQGCYDGWYDLSDAATNVLPRYGFTQELYSTTEFGGRIEYCRNFDSFNAGADVVPHLAALRINRNVSLATAPDSSNINNNLIISF